MRKAEFVMLARKVNFEDQQNVYKMIYFDIEPEKEESGLYKNKLYLVVADVYGVLYTYEIGKLVRKFSSGLSQSPVMVRRIEEYLREKEFLLNSEDQIEDLDKILKRTMSDCGLR